MKHFSVLHKVVTHSLIFALANFSISCVAYRARPVPKNQQIEVDTNKNYYLIIERAWGSSTLVKRDWWQMRELSIDNNRISCRLDPIMIENNTQINFSGSIPEKGSQNVNLFLSRDYDVWSEQTESGKVLIPFTAIDRVEVYDIDIGKTIVFTAFGVGGAVGAIVLYKQIKRKNFFSLEQLIDF